MHLSAAAGVPTLGLFDPTPTWRNRSDATRELSHVEEQVEGCGCGAMKVW
jgi:ADP-heptose:LPS heptosyltransferase